MRYPVAEKLEIIRLVEQSRLPVRRTLDKLGILPAIFYRWYDRYRSGGYEALKDRPPRPRQVWNRIPDDVRGRVLRLALDAPELSPRELATRFIDTEGYFVSETSVYRLLNSPVMKSLIDQSVSGATMITGIAGLPSMFATMAIAMAASN